MNKDKRIIELLEKGGVEGLKDLKFGCRVMALGNKYNYQCVYEGDLGVVLESKSIETFDIKYLGRHGSPILHNCSEMYNLIIGQYGLQDILSCYMINGNEIISLDKYSEGELALADWIDGEYKILELPINTPPMEYTEEKKQELIEFMQNILDR